MKALTDRQDEVLGFIVSYWGENQSMPTMRDICTAFRFGSPNAALRHLRALEKKGWIEMGEATARGIRIPLLADSVKDASRACLRKLSRKMATI